VAHLKQKKNAFFEKRSGTTKEKNKPTLQKNGKHQTVDFSDRKKKNVQGYGLPIFSGKGVNAGNSLKEFFAHESKLEARRRST